MSSDSNNRDTEAAKPRPYRWLGNLALILVIFAGVHWWRASPLAGGEAPPLAGDLVGAGTFDLDNSRSRPVLVHFWATWCPMCRFSDAGIDAIARSHNVITVAIQSGTPNEIMAYLNRESLSFPVIADPNGELATRWGVAGVPASFVLDGNGQVRFTTIGYTTEFGLRARLWAAGKTD